MLYGDANLWYKIAEANGLSSGSALTEGQALNLPAGVTKSTHSADTFKPYDPMEAIGDLSPTTPKPPKKPKCAVFKLILIAVIAAAATVVTAGAALSAAGATLGPAGGLLGGMQAFLGIGGMSVAGVGGISAGVITAGVGAIGAAVGSVASQGAGIALGMQEGFSWKSVGMAALGGAIGGAIGPGGFAGKADGLFSNIGNGIGAQMGAVGLRAMAGSALTQGIGRVTGLQSKFDFAGVAAAGIGAGVGYGVGTRLASKGIFGVKAAADSVANAAASVSASAIANAATRSAINGESFGRNLVAAIPDVMAQIISRAVQTAFDSPIAPSGGGGSGGGGGLAEDRYAGGKLARPKAETGVRPQFANLLPANSLNRSASYSSSFLRGEDWLSTALRYASAFSIGPVREYLDIVVNGTRWAAEIVGGKGPICIVPFNMGLSQSLGKSAPKQSFLNRVDPINRGLEALGLSNVAAGYRGVKGMPRKLVADTWDTAVSLNRSYRSGMASIEADPLGSLSRSWDATERSVGWWSENGTAVPGRLLDGGIAKVSEKWADLTSGNPQRTEQATGDISQFAAGFAGPGMLNRARQFVGPSLVTAEGSIGPLSTVFRGERASMTPEHVFANGLSAKGDNMDLLRHATANRDDSGFIATSPAFDVAHNFAGRNGYVYEIFPERGIDVNARLGSAAPFPEQMEIAIPRGVNATNVKGAYPMYRGKLTGEYIPNPWFGK